MSFFETVCPRCHQKYFTGVVGHEPIGGHDCPGPVLACTECSEVATFMTEPLQEAVWQAVKDENEMAYFVLNQQPNGPGEQSPRCSQHIDGTLVVSAIPA